MDLVKARIRRNRSYHKVTSDPVRKNQIKQKLRDNHLKRTYGITLEQERKMLLEQGEACAICKRLQSELSMPLCVDHDHDTGVVRGLLCNLCNRAIGHLRNSEMLNRAIDYISKPR